jgi:predicted dinucleotide-binding enzyme
MTTYKIAVIGGTGPQGKGLAYRFVKAGHAVTIGSRSTERAQATVEQIAARVGDTERVGGADNAAAAASAEVILLAVPYDGHRALLLE